MLLGIDKRVFSVYNNGCKVFCFTAQLWAKARQTGVCSPADGCFYMDNLRDIIPFLLDIYGALLTDRQRDVLDLYYNDDLSLSEISENLGITRQGVRDGIKRAEQQLLEMEERLGLAKRFRSVQEELTQICDHALQIEAENEKNGGDPVIRQNVESILRSAKKLTD